MGCVAGVNGKTRQMDVKLFNLAVSDITSLGFVGALKKAQRDADNARIMALFSSRDHARKVWDDWDCVSQEGEDAHAYLNMIGDGEYCAV